MTPFAASSQADSCTDKQLSPEQRAARTSRRKGLGPSRSAILNGLWIASVLILSLLLSVRQAPELRPWISLGMIVAMWVLRRLALHHEHTHPVWRMAFMLLGAGLVVRYLLWRTMNTLVFPDIFSAVVGVILYMAELYAALLFFISLFTNVFLIQRPDMPLPANEEDFPSVDILVPSYNESSDLLSVTLIAATQVRYPAHKVKVYLLDDGGTVQKRNDKDPGKSSVAWIRHLELQALCESVGAHYLTRERNEHAKAGNINAALPHTQGDLILILDSDHVPTADILERTVGHFVKDKRLFLVQTPHFFISPDPIEKNLGIFGKMPAENEMFYGRIQLGLDFWEASFFCGSAAILRRSCLEAVGGISTDTITEDSETALMMHAQGWHSAYVDRAMVSGLQPETFSGFILQRLRWAQGMLQILLLKKPLSMPGLRWWQRLAYLSNIIFWLFPLARLVFIFAPAAYILLGLNIYQARFYDILVYVAPQMVANVMVNNMLFGRVRMPFISEVYELMQSLFLAPGVIHLLRHPRAPTFQVTPKGEVLDRDFITQLARPFYWIYLISLLVVAVGTIRLISGWGDRQILTITLGWQILNLALMHTALAALLERRQRRASHRVPTDEPAILGDIDARVTDISTHGAQISVPLNANIPPKGTHTFLKVANPALGRNTSLPVIVKNSRQRNGVWLIGVVFKERELAAHRETVAYAHGDSTRWESYRRQRRTPYGVWASLGTLFHLGTIGSFALLKEVLNQLKPSVLSFLQRLRARLVQSLAMARANKLVRLFSLKVHNDVPFLSQSAPALTPNLADIVLNRVVNRSSQSGQGDFADRSDVVH